MSKVFWKAFFGALGINLVVLGIVFVVSMIFLLGFISSIHTLAQLAGFDLIEAPKIVTLCLIGSGATTIVSFIWSMSHKNIRDDGGLDDSETDV